MPLRHVYAADMPHTLIITPLLPDYADITPFTNTCYYADDTMPDYFSCHAARHYAIFIISPRHIIGAIV